ncbi:4-hydroxylaminobenzoate lyase [Flavimaricola marinus]|uniref:DUF4863 domain-containing protein n=1 Tax=Flavimaricola marinus TaxID=1819565 RepID=A0A238LB67_9RHOB|nr:DUF4863 family protein [Flavimaricola marinus]SMY06919.1 hypothetical protein LOM8899_01049 [Flavimaricola marinus]
MSKERFTELMHQVAESLVDLPVGQEMADHLNATFPKDGPLFEEMTALCAKGEREGWLMGREQGGIKFGRALKPGSGAGRFSVDVVRMNNLIGPHHIHPNGEIGAVMPIEGDPTFDGRGPGWYVYPPGSHHHPTVAGGDAYVLYLLPEGAIEFTNR